VGGGEPQLVIVKKYRPALQSVQNYPNLRFKIV